MTESTKIELPPMEWGMAAIEGLLATLVVLQRNGSLQIAEVAEKLGNTIDFRQQRMPETRGKENALKHVYDMVLLVEKSEAEITAAKAKRDEAGKAPE